jgi:hypothetical protein
MHADHTAGYPDIILTPWILAPARDTVDKKIATAITAYASVRCGQQVGTENNLL